MQAWPKLLGGTEQNLHARRKVMKFRTRGFVSLLLALSFLVAVVSGSVLFMTPRGRVANWTDWTMGGLTKHEWAALHINACLLMVIEAGIHLLLNWRVFWSYIQKKSAGFHLKWELAASILVTGAVVAGTMYEVPPLTAMAAWNERIKDYWEGATPQVPAAAVAEEIPAGPGGGRGRGTGREGAASHGEGNSPSAGHAAVGAAGDLATFGQGPGPGGRGMGMGRGLGGGRGLGRGRGQGGAAVDMTATSEAEPASDDSGPARKEDPAR
jgi:hypothetical protein